MENTTQQAQTRYAGFWIRFAARFIDGIIVGIVLIIVNLVLDAAIGRGNLVAPIIDIFGAFGYFCYMTHKYGATYGKKAFDIHVIADHSERLTWGRVIMREVLGKIVSGIILNIGYLMAAFTARKQGLHDKIADTLVVYNADARDRKKLVIILNIVAIAIGATAILTGFFVARYAVLSQKAGIPFDQSMIPPAGYQYGK